MVGEDSQVRRKKIRDRKESKIKTYRCSVREKEREKIKRDR